MVSNKYKYKFIRFLKKNKCYTNFLYNVQTSHPTMKINDVFAIQKESLIGRYFVWHLSKEGLTFWADINRKWLKLIENGKEEGR